MVINIGLNVGSFEPRNQGFKTMAEILKLFVFKSSDFDIHVGKWESDEGTITERTLVIKAESGALTPLAISSILSNLCVILEQDAIAFKIGEVGYLAYNPSFEGEKFEFSNEYFINI